ncbi:hypothetical protein IVB09_41140 [Bradyrhizobium sp. 174]|nr:hypothetical protein [Bradyrhizobium sp. 174]
MTHKVSVRAALFVGSGLEEQRVIRKLIKEAYGMRSDVVHTGRFSSKRDPRILAEVANISRRALSKIVMRGGMPNWDDVDLGLS